MKRLGMALTFVLMLLLIEAASGSDREVSVTPPSRSTLEACQQIVKDWMAFRTTAESALEICNFHRFHEFCSKATKTRSQVLAKESPCAQIKQVQQMKLPEIHCKIVKVPTQCGAN